MPVPRRKLPSQIPGVIARGLKVLREVSGFASPEALAKDVGRRTRRHPEFKVGASGDTFRDLEDNDGAAQLKYAHLELISGSTGVPSGVFLIATHCTSLFRDGHHEHAKQFSAGLKAMAAAIETEAARKPARMSEVTQLGLLNLVIKVWKRTGLDVTMPLKVDAAKSSARKRAG